MHIAWFRVLPLLWCRSAGQTYSLWFWSGFAIFLHGSYNSTTHEHKIVVWYVCSKVQLRGILVCSESKSTLFLIFLNLISAILFGALSSGWCTTCVRKLCNCPPLHCCFFPIFCCLFDKIFPQCPLQYSFWFCLIFHFELSMVNGFYLFTYHIFFIF